MKIHIKFAAFYNKIIPNLKSYNQVVELNGHDLLSKLENKLEDICLNDNNPHQASIESSENLPKEYYYKSDQLLNQPELNKPHPSDVIPGSKIIKKYYKSDQLQNQPELNKPQPSDVIPGSKIIKKSKDSFENSILFEMLKNNSMEEQILKNMFTQYSEEYPQESQTFYIDNRNSLKDRIDFSIEKEYLSEMINKVEKELNERLNESEKKTHKSKIKITLTCLIQEKEQFYETFLDYFVNMKSMQVFIDFLCLLNKYIPIAFDKFFPPYFQLVEIYKNDIVIVENLINLFKNLREIKSEEMSIVTTRNLIKRVFEHGEVFLREIYDDFPDLENYIYFDDNDNQNLNDESIYTKSRNLLKEYRRMIGPSLIEKPLSIDKCLNYIIIQERQLLVEKNNETNLEIMIQKLNDECGDYYKLELLKKFPELKCTMNIELLSTPSLIQLLGMLKNEIDPYFLSEILYLYPAYKHIQLKEKEKHDENISDILEKINKEIGFFSVESIYYKYPVLKQIKLMFKPNIINKGEINDYEDFKNECIHKPKAINNSKNSHLISKLDKEKKYFSLIDAKMKYKDNLVQDIHERIENHQKINDEINNFLKEKERIERELVLLMKEKNSMLYEAKKNVLDMFKNMENIYKIFKFLDSFDENLVRKFYEVYPEIKNLISFPKNDQLLIEDESKVLKRLLKSDKEVEYTIDDLLQINYKKDNEKLINEIILNAQNKFPVKNLIVNLFFDCIKRKEIFSETLRKIQKVVPKFEITSTNLLEHLLNISNTSLKMMLLNICSRFLPIPFFISSTYDDQSFRLIQEQPEKRHCLITELIYLLEDSCTNLLSFSLSKNKHTTPKGKSHILNSFFGRNFLISDYLKTKPLIEFQFDYHYAMPLKFNVADYHGHADIDIISKLIPFFNYYFIHLLSEELEYYKNEIDQLNSKLRKFHRQFMLIVFVHQEKFPRVNIKEENGVVYCKINTIRNMPETEIRNLKDEIWGLIIKGPIETYPFYRLNSSKKSFIEILRNFNNIEEVNRISSIQKKIDDFENVVFQYKEDFMDERLLPFNRTFMDYSEKLRDFNNKYNEMSDKNKNMEEIKLEKILSIHETQNVPPIVALFHELLYDEHFLSILHDSSSRLKLKIEEGLSKNFKERNEIVDQINKNKDETKKESLENERNRISEVIRKKSFCYEFIIRELYHIYRNDRVDEKNQEKQYFPRISKQLISCGQPFEIIDGDNLHYISNFYQNLFTHDESHILVVSIMGPQSSGKSTLLNFLFGTQFATSSGRCTRGMYGGIMNIENHEKYKKILILDSEGILSAERNDPLFDRKLILFCLCISHVTILCNKGDVHKGMTDILKLTSECMKDLKEQKLSNPNVYVVLNALTDINSDKLMLPFQNLNIDLAGVKMLPFAYEMKDVHSDIKVNIPSTSFSQKCLEFRTEILNQYKKNTDQSNYSLSCWFEFSQTMWDKIDKLKNLINYTNIEELKQDAQLNILIDNYSDGFKNTMSIRDSDNAKLDDIIQEEIVHFDIENFNVIYESVINRLYNQTLILKNQLIDKFTEECKDRDISNELMSKKKNLLGKILSRCIDDWKLILSHKLNEIKVKHSRFGDLILTSEIDRLMKENNNKPYENQTALKLFRIFWDQQMHEVKQKNKLNLKDQKEKCYDLIRKSYENVNKLNSKPDIQREFKGYFDKKDTLIFSKILIHDLLYFNANKRTDVKLILEELEFEKKFMKIPKNIFRIEKTCEYVQINPSEGFNYNLFTNAKFNSKYFWFWDQRKNRKEIGKMLNELFESLKIEADRLFLEFHFFQDDIDVFAEIIHNAKDWEIRDKLKLIEKKLVEKMFIKSSSMFVEPPFFSYFFDKKKLFNYQKGSYTSFEKREKYELIILKRSYEKYYPNVGEHEKIYSVLSWYINPKEMNMSLHNINIGKSYFEMFFDWNAIFDNMFLFVFQSVCKNTEIKNVDFVWEINKIHDACINDKDLKDFNKNFIQFDSDVIRKLIGKTEELIYNINNEIKVFNYAINQESLGIFHEVVMTLFWTLYTMQDFYRENEVIRINNSNRDCYQDFFVSVLTNDSTKIDKDLSHMIMKNIFDEIKNKALNDCQNRFLNNIIGFAEDFKPLNSMTYLDSLIQKGKLKIEETLEFMLKPQERLGKMFEEKWTEKTTKVYEDVKDSWIQDVKGYLNILKTTFSKFNGDLSARDLLKQSNILFEFVDRDNQNKISSESMAQQAYEKEFQKLIITYIHDSIAGNWNENKWIIKDNIKVKPIKPFPRIEPISDPHLKKSILDNLFNKKIINISIFLSEMLLYIENLIQTYHKLMPDAMELDTNLKKKFKDDFIGCYHFCPLCKRKCDQTHSDTKPKHKCESGHQFKVFGGSRFTNSEPSFISCDMMKDTDMVEFEGEVMKWSEFTLKQKEWDFTCKSSYERNAFIGRNKDIWNLIRTNLCHYYKKNHNIIINDVEWYDRANYIQKIHLILLLDDSGSMTGQPWQDLIKAVNEIFQKIMKEDVLKTTKISVLTHSSTTITSFQEKEASSNLMTLINPRYGGTNFEDALLKGYDCIIGSKERFDTFLVGFMSDGFCGFPSNIITKINKDEHNLKNRIQYNCILFGKDQGGITIMKQIAENLHNGKFTHAITFNELKQSFIEILNV